jgi:pimeloyl-ACP methyl ester carboxylesterase
MEPPAAQRLAEIQVPALVIVGEYDLPDFQQIALVLEQQLAHVHKVLVPEAGHMANMEAPQIVNEAILQFLASLTY